jgi:uncharacterized radical SAM superfamily Fe-S cluster-containing enzyme
MENTLNMAASEESDRIYGKEIVVKEEKSPQEPGNNGEILLKTSQSVCPECMRIIEGRIISKNNKVYLRKTCEEHGTVEVPVYSDTKEYLKAVKNNKPGTKPLHYQGSVREGCPRDCGLCEDHKQHTCVGIIEITEKCNLRCPVCFMDSTNGVSLPFEHVKKMIDLYVKCEGTPEVLQISGGEPTIHPDIFRILEYAGSKGIKYPMLNTNGIKLADIDFAKKISHTMDDRDSLIGRPLIYMQFDGVTEETYTALRGRPLLELKLKALENCRNLGMNVALVPTVVKGINDHEIGRIIDLALSDNNIKTVNFQPAALTGRFEPADKLSRRMTVSDILDEIEAQTSNLVKKKDFMNIPCPYPTCSTCNYVYKFDDNVFSISDFLDTDDFIEDSVNRAIPDDKLLSEVDQALKALFSMSAVLCSDKTEEALDAICGIEVPDIKGLVDNITLISVHAFMDEYSFDLERAKKCCVTEILPNGQMIPFCVYNVIYRKQLTPAFRNLC